MYTLLGLIQMLMLTQSRLMPDLDVLFRPATNQTEAVSHFPAGTQQLIDTGSVYRVAIGIIHRKRNDEKWIPTVRRNKITPKFSIKNSFCRTRVLAAGKLYLVFCQWKTEG